MKLMRFITISLLIGISGYRAHACSDYYTPEMCNMFSVYNHNDLYSFNYLNMYEKSNSVYVAQFNFWKSYFKKGVSPKVIQSAIFMGDAKSLKSLTRIIRKRKDADGLNYMKLFQQMHDVSTVDEWDYPDKKLIQNNNRIWNNILANASSHILTSKTFGSRYWLMAMRAAYYTNKKQLCQQLWNKYQSRFASANDIHTLAEGYMASYWYQNGEREKAREFYAKTGDLASLRWCFKDDIGIKGIKKLYAEAPNSVAFPYLIQDYVNSVDNDLHPVWEYDTSDSLLTVVRSEIKEFRDFAQQVIKEGKVKTPALWKSASGYFAYLLDDSETAIKELDEAAAMEGTDRMKDNIRVLRFFVKSKSSHYDASFDNYALNELKWIMDKVKAERSYIDYSWYAVRNHYSDVLERIVYYNLTPGYVKAGKFSTGAALSDMGVEFVDLNYRKNKRPLKNVGWSEGYYTQDYSNRIFTLLDTADVKDVVAYKELLESPAKGSELEQYALSFCHHDINYYNDIIGTKYLRIEDFAKASEYLSKVTPSFLSSIPISSYLHADSSYPIWYAWRNRKLVDKQRYVETQLTVNPKLLFSNEMMALQNKLKLATDDKEKAAVNYELAKKYMQATQKGYCWSYLHYGWSVDSAFCATNYKEKYIEHAEMCLKSSMQLDPSVGNRVNCLFALAYLAEDSPWRTYVYNETIGKDVPLYHPESKQVEIFSELYKLRSNKEFELQGLSRCDNLKSYLGYYGNR